MSKVHEVLLKHGKISQEQFDKAALKSTKHDVKELAKMTKAELIEIILNSK